MKARTRKWMFTVLALALSLSLGACGGGSGGDDVRIPNAPGAPTLTASDAQLAVSWTAVSDATAYEVWYGTADDSAAAAQFGADVPGTSTTITGLTNDTLYYVWLKAKNSAGTSAFGPSASETPVAPVVAPDPPGAPTLTAGDTELAVSWTPVSGATAYEVWYGTTDVSGDADQFGTDVAGTSTTITGLSNGTAYYVWLKAKNTVGTSAFGPSASATPVAPPAALVLDFEADAIGTVYGEMGWNATDISAVVSDDPLAPGTGNNVLHVSFSNYNSAPVITLNIPEGKTLGDYNTFSFRGHFVQGDVGWKHIRVYAYATAPSGQQAFGDGYLGDYNRDRGPSTAWETIDVDISSNTSALTGTVYLAFGFNAGEPPHPSVWYADDVTLAE